MATSPSYSIGDVVYLTSSAKIGFLESYKVSSIGQATAGKWVYQITLAPVPPTATMTVGDTVNHRNLKTLYFDESELMDYPTASQLQIDSLTRRLNAAIAARNAALGI